jgi:hypothetical protein
MVWINWGGAVLFIYYFRMGNKLLVHWTYMLRYCLDLQLLIQDCRISNQVQSLGGTNSQTAFLHLQQMGY